eukprot:tig00020610_g12027.t1
MALKVIARLFLSGKQFSRTWAHLDHLSHFSFPPEIMLQFEPDRQLLLDVFRRDAPQILESGPRSRFRLPRQALLIPMLPGPCPEPLGPVITPERYASILSKALFNCTPVVPASTSGEGASGDPPPLGDRAVKGFALYFAASYANHGCIPSAAVEFPEDDATAVFTALRPLSAGEEITRAYLPTKGRTAAERQAELKASCSFDCACQACSRGVDL